MKTLIIFENSLFASFLQDFVRLIRPDEKVEITDEHDGIAISSVYYPDVILYDFDRLGFWQNRFLQSLSTALPSAQILGFTNRTGQIDAENTASLLSCVYRMDEAVDRLMSIYCQSC